MDKFQQSQALTSHFESFWSIVKRPFQKSNTNRDTILTTIQILTSHRGENCANSCLFTFTDQNECEEWGYCDQLCSNTFGSYKCSCNEGYVRRDDTCVADPSSKKMVLYMAYHNKILAMDQTGKIHRQVKPLAPETLYIFAQRKASSS